MYPDYMYLTTRTCFVQGSMYRPLVVLFDDKWIDCSVGVCVPSARVNSMTSLRRYLRARLGSGNLETVRSVHVLPAASLGSTALQQLVEGGALALETPTLWRSGYFDSALAIARPMAAADDTAKTAEQSAAPSSSTWPSGIVYDVHSRSYVLGVDEHKSKKTGQLTQTRSPYLRLRETNAGKVQLLSNWRDSPPSHPQGLDPELALTACPPHHVPLGIGINASDDLLPALERWQTGMTRDDSFGHDAQASCDYYVILCDYDVITM